MALLRYEGQRAELAIAWPGDADAARAAFAATHRALNGFTLEIKVELDTLRVEAEGSVPPSARPMLPRGYGAKEIGRQILHGGSGSVEALVFDRARLGAGDRIIGPAIVTQLDATTLVAPGWWAELLASGSLLLFTGCNHKTLCGRYNDPRAGRDDLVHPDRCVHVKATPGRAFPLTVTAFEPARRMVWTGGMSAGRPTAGVNSQ